MFKEIFANAVVYFIFIFIIYSTIKIAVENERLEKYIEDNFETFEFTKKVYNEIIDLEKRLRLIELDKDNEK